MNKPGKSFPRPLADLLHKTLTDAFAKQGFASSELVTRWADIVGAEIAAHSEPEKIQWTRGADGHEPAPQRAGDPEAAARIAAGLPEIADEKLRAALGRLGAAIKQS